MQEIIQLMRHHTIDESDEEIVQDSWRHTIRLMEYLRTSVAGRA
jgi:hypothetical protein